MATGATNTYDLVTGIKLDIDSMIQLLSPYDTPLLGGGGDAQLALASESVFEKKVEWLDEELLTPRSTTVGTATTGDTFITVAAGERVRFQTGDIILIGAEYMRITGYGTTTDTLTVTRAYSGSAGTVAASAIVIGIGSALPEGSNAPSARWIDRNNRFNHTEIFGPYEVKSTESDVAIQKYGVASEFDKQAGNRLKEAAIAIEQTAIYGVRVEDTSNRWRSMNGILAHITTNIDSTTTTFSETAELDALQTIYTQGGSADTLMVGPKNKRIASGWTSSGQLRLERGDSGRGTVVDVFESDFGTVRIKLNRWMRTADAVNFSRDQARFGVLRPMTFEMLGKVGDYRAGMIVTERTMRFYRQRHAQKFTALT